MKSEDHGHRKPHPSRQERDVLDVNQIGAKRRDGAADTALNGPVELPARQRTSGNVVDQPGEVNAPDLLRRLRVLRLAWRPGCAEDPNGVPPSRHTLGDLPGVLLCPCPLVGWVPVAEVEDSEGARHVLQTTPGVH